MRLRLCSVLIVAITLLAAAAHAEWFSETRNGMGTRLYAEVYSGDADLAHRALARVMAEMDRIEAEMSPLIESSALARMNRAAGQDWVRVPAELLDVLAQARRMSELSGGAFDVTFASAGRYYDYRAGRRPDAATLAAAVRAIDYRYVELDPAARAVRYAHPAVYVDLGGIAKGYAVDRCIELLQSLGIDDAVVSAGGDSRIIGDRHGRPWMVGVRDPRRAGEMAVVMPLERTAVSTSGDYERFFEQDGVRYHHIIDPDTGDSAREVRSVTIVGPRATRTDALSTTVFVLGVEAGLSLLERTPGYDGVIVDAHGRLFYSSGLHSPVAMAD